jgi:hypothetical protein
MLTLARPELDQRGPHREKGVKKQTEQVRSALKASWFADAEYRAHEKAEVETGDVDEYAFENVAVVSQVSPSHRARFERVGEGSFEQLAALSEHRLASLAADATAVAVHRIALDLLVLPVPPSAFGLGNVPADSEYFEIVITSLL